MASQDIKLDDNKEQTPVEEKFSEYNMSRKRK
jgi:hypothetical protein